MGDGGEEKRSVLRWTAGLSGGALVFYVGSFLLIVLDELVFETHWLWDVTSSSVQEAIVIFYYPLIWLYELWF